MVQLQMTLPMPAATPYLTKYELCRCLGLRTAQLTQAIVSTDSQPRSVALKELIDGTCPLTVRRIRPDGSPHDVPVSSLRLRDCLRQQCQDML